MERYIGLDVHLQSCTMAVMGPSGKRLKSLVLETNGRTLVDAIVGIAGHRNVCLEEGTQSAWIYELLSPHAEVVVTVPQKRKGSKDDLRDAWLLAEELRIGKQKTVVYKAPEQFTELRNAVRAYDKLTRDVVRVKNRLKALYRSRGIATTKDIYEAETRERWEQKLPVSFQHLAAITEEQLDALVELQEEAEVWLKREAKSHNIVRMLSTAPGMGVIRTSQLVAIVVTPHRFRTTRQFWSYCGLGIVTRSTANWINHNGKWMRANITQTLGLSRRRNSQLKSVFKGAATTVLRKLRGHPLFEDYERMLQAGTKPNLAKLTLARRIAATVLSMWKHEEEYNPEKARKKKNA